jgi:hypothetical protein
MMLAVLQKNRNRKLNAVIAAPFRTDVYSAPGRNVQYEESFYNRERVVRPIRLRRDFGAGRHFEETSRDASAH